jgi:hypothetical protein
LLERKDRDVAPQARQGAAGFVRIASGDGRKDEAGNSRIQLQRNFPANGAEAC